MRGVLLHLRSVRSIQRGHYSYFTVDGRSSEVSYERSATTSTTTSFSSVRPAIRFTVLYMVSTLRSVMRGVLRHLRSVGYIQRGYYSYFRVYCRYSEVSN